jgi:hypothetical protein
MNKKIEIENFIEKRKEDIIMLDLLWIFYYSIVCTFPSAYFKNQKLLHEQFGKIVGKTLNKKYGLEKSQIIEKIKDFEIFFNFFSKKTFENDKKLLREALLKKTSEILIQYIKSKLKESDKILSFVLNYLSMKVNNNSIKEECPSFSEVGIIKNTNDFFIIPGDLVYKFNRFFNKNLDKPQFEDRLIETGIGYLAFWLSCGGYVYEYFAIPDFIYGSLRNLKDKLLKLENFEEKIKKIEKEEEENEFELRFGLKEPEPDSKVDEEEIENSIVKNPEILEDGLRLIRNQYQTHVGRIDILCRDKNGNYVIIELKSDKGSHKVVGQIQKYMAWVEENLAKKEGKKIRGIIVVKESDKSLESAIKGSKYEIEIKKFGKVPPVERNIRYCIHCGAQLPVSANFCKRCGKEVWL